MKERWIYEIRCRKCDEIKEMVIGSSDRFTYKNVLDYMYAKISGGPELMDCDGCGFNTVHDVICFKTIE